MNDLPATIDLSEYSGQKWKNFIFPGNESDGNVPSKPTNSKQCSVVVPLSREFFAMYQEFPIIDSNLLYDCKICGKVLQPGAIREHCASADHQKNRAKFEANETPVVQPYRSRKSTSKSILNANTSSANISNVYLNTVKTSPSVVINPGLAAALAQTASTPAISASANGRNKRTASKSTKRTRREEKSEKVAGSETTISPADGIYAKKVKREPEESSAQTFVNIPTAPAKAASLPISISNNLIKEDVKPVTTSILTHTTPRTTFIKIASASQSQQPASVLSLPKKKEQLLPIKQEVTTKTSLASASNQDTHDTDLAHVPMSPVAVVNIVPVQYLPQYLQLPTQPFVVTIPTTHSNVHMCSYPKPLAVSTRAIRKIGNTYLLQNQRLDHQRAEIEAITRTQRAFANTTLNHMPTT